MKCVLIPVVFVGLVLVGCVPFKVKIGQPTTGTVVSKETLKPIPHAQVMYKGHTATTVVTGADGRFFLTEATVTKWLIPFPIDYFGWRWHPLKVRAEGCRALTFKQHYRDPSKPNPPLIVELSSLK